MPDFFVGFKSASGSFWVLEKLVILPYNFILLCKSHWVGLNGELYKQFGEMIKNDDTNDLCNLGAEGHLCL